MDQNDKIAALTEGFAASAGMLAAIGNETRQHLILEMLKAGDCSGMRVGKIARRTNLSRTAVSHHLRVLMDAGIVKVRKEGTKNYYYFDPEMNSFEKLVSTLRLAAEMTKELSGRRDEAFAREIQI